MTLKMGDFWPKSGISRVIEPNIWRDLQNGYFTTKTGILTTKRGFGLPKGDSFGPGFGIKCQKIRVSRPLGRCQTPFATKAKEAWETTFCARSGHRGRHGGTPSRWSARPGVPSGVTVHGPPSIRPGDRGTWACTGYFGSQKVDFRSQKVDFRYQKRSSPVQKRSSPVPKEVHQATLPFWSTRLHCLSGPPGYMCPAGTCARLVHVPVCTCPAGTCARVHVPGCVYIPRTRARLCVHPRTRARLWVSGRARLWVSGRARLWVSFGCKKPVLVVK